MTTKNREVSFAKTTKFVKYFPALREITGGVLAAILMVQLDMLFSLNAKFAEFGFYMFLKPVYARDERGEVIFEIDGKPKIGNRHPPPEELLK